MINEKLGISQFQRNNLEKLAAYLETNPQERGFDMSIFFYSAKKGTLYPNKAKTLAKCETIACAVGHGPDAGIPSLKHESWGQYSSRCFITGNAYSASWNWCFSGQWESTDNTAIGAAKRIRWFLEHGVPKNWYRQLRKHDTLCYDTTHLE